MKESSWTRFRRSTSKKLKGNVLSESSPSLQSIPVKKLKKGGHDGGGTPHDSPLSSRGSSERQVTVGGGKGETEKSPRHSLANKMSDALGSRKKSQTNLNSTSVSRANSVPGQVVRKKQGGGGDNIHQVGSRWTVTIKGLSMIGEGYKADWLERVLRRGDDGSS